MEYLTDFRHMSSEEKKRWMDEFTRWSTERMPELHAGGAAWNSSLVNIMEEGLKLMSVFPFCRDFVEKSMLFRDYPRRLQRLHHYVERVRKETEGMAVPPATRRRGRPTRAESVRMAQEKENRRMLFAAGNENDEKNPVQEQKEEGNTLADAVSLSAASGVMLHLDQLSWLLSASLRERIGQVSSLRNVAATESNTAKDMGIKGFPSSEIAPHSEKAVESVNAYKAIYAEVDRELGVLYAALFGDAPDTQTLYDYGELCRRKGVEFPLLRKVLKPYWEKSGCPSAVNMEIPEMPTEDPEEKVERQARLHSIRTYFMRKDMAPSPRRVNRMKELIEEVRSYGLCVEDYELILKKTEEELENPREKEEEDVH